MATLAQPAIEDQPLAVPIDLRRNVVAFTGDISTFMVGTYFIPATTVLVGLASQLTDDCSPRASCAARRAKSHIS